MMSIADCARLGMKKQARELWAHAETGHARTHTHTHTHAHMHTRTRDVQGFSVILRTILDSHSSLNARTGFAGGWWVRASAVQHAQQGHVLILHTSLQRFCVKGGSSGFLQPQAGGIRAKAPPDSVWQGRLLPQAALHRPFAGDSAVTPDCQASTSLGRGASLPSSGIRVRAGEC